MQYTYKAKKATGEIITSTEEFESKVDLYKKLHQEGLVMISVDENAKKTFLNYKINFFGKRVKMHEKIVFARNLAVMLNAGLTLSRGITIIAKQSKNQYLKEILENIDQQLRSGKTFNETLTHYPKVFPPIFVSMVAAGEESGKLAEALETIGSQMEKNYLLMKKVKGALIYPAVIICLMGVMGIFMLVYVVPTLTSTFKELNVDLPIMTQIIIGISDFLRAHYLIGLIGAFVLVSGIISLAKRPGGKRFLDTVVLKLPVIGTLVKEVNAARTARTLSSLLGSGVSVVDSLHITADVLQNSHYKKVLQEAGRKIQLGSPISTVFVEAEKIYPIYMGEMIAVGEETGELGSMLSKVAQFFEGEVEQKTKDMSTIIEPILMIIVGAGVGFFALSMISPMYSLADKI
jgi:type IV pilus assembly protein PilC